MLNYATNELTICGLAGVPKDCGITKDNARFEPRGGIAYRLSNSTVVRAGYALSTVSTNLGDVTGNRQNFPDIVATTIPSTNSFYYATSLRTGLPPVVAPDYSSGTVAVPLTTGVYTVNNSEFSRGYIESWNLTVEQQLPGWMLSVGYVGMRNIHQMADGGIDENWGTIGTGSAGQRLTMLTGRTASTVGLGAYGTATFDGFEATVIHALSHDFQVNASYTYGKALSFGTGIAIPSLYRLNYGNTAGVQRNNAGIALILLSPFGKNQSWATSGVPAQILGNWKLETVTSLRTGSPFTVTGSNTTLNAAGSTQRANCSRPKKIGTPSEWYDVSAFSEPATGTIGNCGANTLWGPATNMLDAAVDRTFPIHRESTQLEFRASMFNAPNNPHHGTPTSSLTSSSFMQAKSIANTGRDGIDQRTIELSLRLSF